MTRSPEAARGLDEPGPIPLGPAVDPLWADEQHTTPGLPGQVLG